MFNFSLDSTVQFSCDEDYVLQGAKSITCQRIAEVFAAWSDHRPVCKGKIQKSVFFHASFLHFFSCRNKKDIFKAGALTGWLKNDSGYHLDFSDIYASL